MAELERLLGFMSSWDRQAALKKYRGMFAARSDEAALIEELGTPTKLAIELAASYVPSRPPSALAEALLQCPVELEDLLRDPGALAADLLAPPPAAEPAPKPETWSFEEAPPAEEQPEADAPEAEPEPSRSRLRTGALICYLIPAIVIGLPVTVLLVCVGLPFLVSGAGLIFTAALQAMQFIGSLRLVSDVLMVIGSSLIVCAVGLALCWLGLWLSMELCWLWAGKALVGLGKRLCLRKEAAQ